MQLTIILYFKHNIMIQIARKIVIKEFKIWFRPSILCTSDFATRDGLASKNMYISSTPFKFAVFRVIVKPQ